jgi:hypothetical protein
VDIIEDLPEVDIIEDMPEVGIIEDTPEVEIVEDVPVSLRFKAEMIATASLPDDEDLGPVTWRQEQSPLPTRHQVREETRQFFHSESTPDDYGPLPVTRFHSPRM